MRNQFFIIFLLLIGFSACKTTQKSDTSLPRLNSKKLNELVQKNNFDFDYFSNKMRVNLNKQSFTANLRMKKDSVIWISFTGPFNIEGARVRITPNRFEMIDKLNKKYYDTDMSYVKNFIPVDIDFALLQDIIIGNVLEKPLKKQKVKIKKDAYFVKGAIPKLETHYSILPNGRLKEIEVFSKTEDRSMLVFFDKYEKLDNQLFALKRKFLIQDQESKFVLDLKFYKYKEGKPNFPFDVPSHYTRVK